MRSLNNFTAFRTTAKVSQGQNIADAIRQIGVSEVAFAMNYSMVKFSTRCARPASSSKAGAVTTTRSGRINLSATSRLHRKCSSQPSPRGRLRYADRLRRPRWRNGQLSINIPPGPLSGGPPADGGNEQPADRGRWRPRCRVYGCDREKGITRLQHCRAV
jgi:hypothetical protein